MFKVSDSLIGWQMWNKNIMFDNDGLLFLNDVSEQTQWDNVISYHEIYRSVGKGG